MDFRILIGAILVFGFGIAFLLGENMVLKRDMADLRNAYEEQSVNYVTISNNLSACNTSLDLQNEAIKASKVQIDNTPSKEVEKIKRIYIKDKSCEGELRAYKELFK